MEVELEMGIPHRAADAAGEADDLPAAVTHAGDTVEGACGAEREGGSGAGATETGLCPEGTSKREFLESF